MLLRLATLLALAVAAAVAVDAGSPDGRSPLPSLDSAAPAVAAPSGPRCPLPAPLRPHFEHAAADSRLPLALLVAVAETESQFVTDAISTAGARGVLQVMPATAAELELDVEHVPSNILAGARYLRRMLDLFSSTELALAAYNAGPTAVAEAGRAPSDETVGYVAAVTSRWRDLAGCR